MRTEAVPEAMLEADHRELDLLLAGVVTELFRESPDTVAIYRHLDHFWARLAVHIRAEHLVVFPAVLESVQAESGKAEAVSRTLKDLRHDHDFFMKELARAIKAMRLVPEFGNERETIEIVKRLVEGVAARLLDHNRIEEESIYPLASQISDDPGRKKFIAIRTKAELENMPARFKDRV
jgi:hemerythrin superfamily protein